MIYVVQVTMSNDEGSASIQVPVLVLDIPSSPVSCTLSQVFKDSVTVKWWEHINIWYVCNQNFSQCRDMCFIKILVLKIKIRKAYVSPGRISIQYLWRMSWPWKIGIWTYFAPSHPLLKALIRPPIMFSVNETVKAITI